MNLFDIIGPVMVGPSSSHTAGAVRIGNVSRTLLGEDVLSAEIDFHGSFLATGKGHGTDRAIVAGLLGYPVDDARIPDSMEWAQKNNMTVKFGSVDLGEEAHPNSVLLHLLGVNGRTLDVTASSIGGGRILINEIDGTSVNISGDYPTLVIHNQDQPGCVAAVTTVLQQKQVNISGMRLYRSKRGGAAVMVLECDQTIDEGTREWIKGLPGVEQVIYLA